MEREALALVWACERLLIYLIGKTFDLHTDHKPLEVISGKKHNNGSACIKRWRMRLQGFISSHKVNNGTEKLG